MSKLGLGFTEHLLCKQLSKNAVTALLSRSYNTVHDYITAVVINATKYTQRREDEPRPSPEFQSYITRRMVCHPHTKGTKGEGVSFQTQ